MSKRARLIYTILTTGLWEFLLWAAGRWLLPLLGVRLPVYLVVLVMAVLGVYAVFAFQVGTRALARKPVAGLTSMIGTRGKAVRRVAADGQVKIKDEIWAARSVTGPIKKGVEVTVVGQEGLTLVVRESKRA